MKCLCEVSWPFVHHILVVSYTSQSIVSVSPVSSSRCYTLDAPLLDAVVVTMVANAEDAMVQVSHLYSQPGVTSSLSRLRRSMPVSHG